MLHGQPPPRRILADNLTILGFSPSNYNNPHYSGVNLTEDAFAGANNTKAFELISWFLFNKLDSHKARKVSYARYSSSYINKILTQRLAICTLLAYS
jgi:hypothetical protein